MALAVPRPTSAMGARFARSPTSRQCVIREARSHPSMPSSSPTKIAVPGAWIQLMLTVTKDVWEFDLQASVVNATPVISRRRFRAPFTASWTRHPEVLSTIDRFGLHRKCPRHLAEVILLYCVDREEAIHWEPKDDTVLSGLTLRLIVVGHLAGYRFSFFPSITVSQPLDIEFLVMRFRVRLQVPRTCS